MKDYTQPISGFKFAEKQNAWLHRNNHNGDVAWRFLGFNEKGEFTPNAEIEYYISVGCISRNLKYSDFKEIDVISPNDKGKEKWEKFEKICIDKLYDGKKPRYRHSLWRFLFEFKSGDILLVPGNYGDFHVFKIVSDKVIYREELKHISELPEDPKHDFHYFWKVEPIRVKMSRYLIADQSLISRMKIRGTTSWLDDDLKNSIENAVKTEGRIQPGILATEAAKTLFWKSIQKNIDDNKFERLIRWYFLKKGADSARILPKKTEGEKDADVEATFDSFRLKRYVQAKKHDNKVNIEKAYNQIKKYKEHLENVPINDGYTNLYWIIYSSMKEQNAEILDSDDIRVISGNEFAEMLLDVGIADLDRAFFDE